ncbi:hypothetical protein HanXRQr2_Chr04g0173031 [Helianthus annuus]|uniref:Uncharacterized protein n=1 Tax=Helianthus annuus TaxID=4232 RepID=A0A251UZQ4_HELAN|nr:hypothetical protein HanXRQr2_Chr04g0173031 [Helianthus annuus]KAJ0589467.1 hypothetical protein HanIR_Chr04g0186601 [Helianthus annuus]KAJ0931845.1 hypothetical protein HanPSC8_Chr04g0166691 [Helianthus annuus]
MFVPSILSVVEIDTNLLLVVETDTNIMFQMEYIDYSIISCMFLDVCDHVTYLGNSYHHQLLV